MDLRRPPRIYVAGPYTNGDTMGNIRRALQVADRLSECGAAPYVPHLSGFHDLVSPHDYDFWLAQDLVWLGCCDALVRLPGQSEGVAGEVRAARSLGLPCFLLEADLSLPADFDTWLQSWGAPAAPVLPIEGAHVEP